MSTEEEFVCSCGKNFKSKSGLSGHQRLTGHQPASPGGSEHGPALGGDSIETTSSQTESQPTPTVTLQPPRSPSLFDPKLDFQTKLRQVGATRGAELIADLVFANDPNDPATVWSVLRDSGLSPSQSKLIMLSHFKEPWTTLEKKIGAKSGEKEEDSDPFITEIKKVRREIELAALKTELGNLRSPQAGTPGQTQPVDSAMEKRFQVLEEQLKAQQEENRQLKAQLDETRRKEELQQLISPIQGQLADLSTKLDKERGDALAAKVDSLKAEMKEARAAGNIADVYSTLTQGVNRLGDVIEKVAEKSPIDKLVNLATSGTIPGGERPLRVISGAKNKVLENVAPEFVVEQ